MRTSPTGSGLQDGRKLAIILRENSLRSKEGHGYTFSVGRGPGVSTLGSSYDKVVALPRHLTGQVWPQVT